jgi:hypothetical protein
MLLLLGLLIPGFPSGASATQTVTLAWDRSIAADVIGYNLYYGPTSGNYTGKVAVGNVTTAVVAGLQENKIYYFAATAVNGSNLESDPSTEISYLVPGPSMTNQPPTLDPIQDLTISQNGASQSIILTGISTGSASEVQTLTVSALSGNPGLIPNPNVLYTSPNPTGSLIISPVAFGNGTAWITVNVNDGQSITSRSFKVTVISSNAPVIVVPGGSTANAGNYNGLFFNLNDVTQDTSGSFTLSLNAKGSFSGNLRLGGARLGLSGQFNLHGTAQKIIARRNNKPLKVTLQFDPLDSDRITGTVTDGIFIADLVGDRAVFNVRQNPAPQAGQYTMVLPGASDMTSAPGGHSFGTIKVDKGGKLRMSGSLADGTKISQAVPISKNRDWPLYIPLYGGRGSLLSWIKFEASDAADLHGDIIWSKPALPTAKMYPGGFTLSTTASGSQYTRPAAGNYVLSLSDGQVVLRGGGLDHDIINQIQVDARNRVTNLSDNKLNLTFTPTTGLFKGRVTDPATSKPISFSGVILQKSNAGLGWFMGQNQQSGTLTVEGP